MTATRQVRCKDVLIGGGAPCSIQSMTNVDSRDEAALLDQICRLKDAGCQIVRIAVPDMESAQIFAQVRRKTSMPLVADMSNQHGQGIGGSLPFVQKPGSDFILVVQRLIMLFSTESAIS